MWFIRIMSHHLGLFRGKVKNKNKKQWRKTVNLVIEKYFLHPKKVNSIKLELTLSCCLKTKHAGIWFSSHCIHWVESITTMAPLLVKYSKTSTLVLVPFYSPSPSAILLKEKAGSTGHLTDPWPNQCPSVHQHLFHTFLVWILWTMSF